MNTQHLKYIVEVAKAGSISLAAEKLYMNQPNLSKAIREIETSAGIDIFRRTSKGIVPTKQGEEFIGYAKNILEQIDQMETIYKKKKENKISFNLTVPRASYISHAFTLFLNRLDHKMDMEIHYKETDALKTIKNIVEGEYHLGIIRYYKQYESNFLKFIKEKLDHEDVWEYTAVVLMGKNNPLALTDSLTDQDLNDGLEIIHGDWKVPYLSTNGLQTREAEELKKSRRVCVYERGSQFDLLNQYTSSYMWASPLPPQQLERYGLVQRSCCTSSPIFKDILVYRRGHKLTKTERLFVEELHRVRDTLAQNA